MSATTDRILVVDDSLASRKLLATALAKAGYAVREALDAFEAIRLVHEWGPHLVLLDVGMPERDGFEVCEILKADEATAAIPVIFLTALTGSTDIERAFAVGGSDYVSKPFHLNEVKARVLVHLHLRRAKEELERAHGDLLHSQKLESLGQLAAGIAHEINTPTQYVGDNTTFLQEAFGDLAGLLASASELVSAVLSGEDCEERAAALQAAFDEADYNYLSEEIPRAIEQSLDGLDHVSRIVRAMKEFSHPGVQEMAAIDVNRAIESTVTVAKNEWKYIAELVLHLEPDLPLLPCLPGELNQVLLNLIVNAAHAIADVVGGSGEKGRIEIATEAVPDAIEIRIGDSGSGIPENVRGRIFDPFFTTKEVGKGTGQGLSIAHTVIVQKHGGSLTFQTEEGRGTVFTIRLPLNRTDEAQAA